MAIFTPHESQAEVYVGYGGRAANYAGASTFRTPDQTALPEALGQLSSGLGKLGGALHEVSLERQDRRNLADMLADQVAEKDAFRAFDADYRQTHKGADAREAEADYESYFSERREVLRRKWDGNQRLMLAAEQMFAPIRQSGLDGAYAYSLREEEEYAKRGLAAAEMGLLREAADPAMAYKDKLAGLADFEISLRRLAGGRNVAPELAAVRRNFALEHLQGLLLNGKTGEATAYVNGNKGMFGDKTNDALMKISTETDRRRMEARKQGEAIVANVANLTTYAVEKNDFSAYREAENALYAMGRTREADKMRDYREMYEMARPVLESARQAPFTERAAKIRETFGPDSPRYTQENAAAMQEVRKNSLALLQKEYEAFNRDPAEYVRRTQNLTASGNPGDIEAEAQANMAWQRVMSGDPNFPAMPMTTAQAREFQTMLYDPRGDGNAKVERLLGAAMAYGDLMPQVLAQIKADPAVYAAARLALDTGNDTAGTARKLLAAATTPDKDVPQNADVTGGDITSMLAGSEYMRYLAGVTRAFPSQGGLLADYGAMRDAAAKMIKRYGKESLAGLDAPYEFEVDDGERMYLRIPRQNGIDADDAAGALRWIRDGMAERISGLSAEAAQTLRLKGAWRTSGTEAVLSVDGVARYRVPLAEAVGEFKAFTEKAREAALLDMSYEADVRDIPYMGVD